MPDPRLWIPRLVLSQDPALLAGLWAAAILLGYAVALWWLLRRESTPVLVGLLAVCCASLSLRLVYTTEYPTGLNEDEVKTLWKASADYRQGRLLEVGYEGPLLLNVLFQAQAVPVVGANRWAIRTYSTVTSVLASAVAFAVGRALGLRAAPSMGIAALLAVLPWSLFYGRISFGGELIFHQLLLLAALARLIWQNGDWREVLIGSLGLCLLLYDYTAGWVMVGMPIVAAVLAQRWRRAMCLLVLVLAVGGWLPFAVHSLHDYRDGVTNKVPSEYATDALGTLQAKVFDNLVVFIGPRGRDGWLTIRSAAMHPPLILVVAAVGSLTGVRRGLFLWAGFLGAMLPSVLSEGLYPSAHRMLMMFPFVAIAAGCALNLLRGRWGVLATCVVVPVVGVHSVMLYFSPSFWPEQSQWVFDAERTGVVEALPPSPHPRFVVSEDVTPFLGMRTVVDSNHEVLTGDNWFPASGRPAIYVFGPASGILAPFYEHFVGYAQVRRFGRAFLATVDGRDWSWLKQYGWTYDLSCGPQLQRQAQVPTFFKAVHLFPNMACGKSRHTWRATWIGPRALLRLHFSGSALVDTPQGRLLEASGIEQTADFTAEPGTPLIVTVDTDSPYWKMGLMEVTPAGERVPAFEYARAN